MVHKDVKEDVIIRLRLIEGQVRGLIKMVDNNKYCIDILNQTSAVRRGLESVSLMILKQHVEGCVVDSFKKGKGSGKKVDELISVIDHFVK